LKDKLKTFGKLAAGGAVLIGFALLPVLFIKGGIWFSQTILPFMKRLSELTTVVVVLVLLPCAIFKRLRGFASIGLLVGSFVYGATLWLLAFLVTFQLWGWVALLIGMCFLGVGVVPIAMLAAVSKGEWPIFWSMVITLGFVIGARVFSYFLSNSFEKYRFEKSYSQGYAREMRNNGQVLEVEAETVDPKE